TCPSPFSLPSWTEPFVWSGRGAIRGLHYLLTFRPFGQLPAAVQKAYLAGHLHLWPFPGSLVFWGVPAYHRLSVELTFALPIPMRQRFGRFEHPTGVRIPQSGGMHEPRPGQPAPRTRRVLNTYRRTHRWARVTKYEDELAVSGEEDHLAHVLFSNAPADVALYNKPMARNVQIWTHDFRRLLDGPQAGWDEIHYAHRTVAEGGLFGYRFVFPAMRVGRHEIYWHRPL